MATKKKKINFAQKFMSVGGAVAGGIAGGLLANKGVPMILKNASPMVRNLIPLALGGVASIFLGENPLIAGFANGMVATASQKVVGSFVPQLAGIGNADAGMNLLDVPEDELISLEGPDVFDESVNGDGGYDVFDESVNGTPYQEEY